MKPTNAAMLAGIKVLRSIGNPTKNDISGPIRLRIKSKKSTRGSKNKKGKVRTF